MYVVGTNTKRFKSWYSQQGIKRNNGSYWYARELEDIILPEVDLHLFIVTAGASLYKPYEVPDGAAIVCHDNRTSKKSYGRFFNKNILWVCSKHSTVENMQSYGERAAYVPLSIDTQYVKQFKRKKTKDIAYVGNAWAFKKDYLDSLPKDVVQLSDLERDALLREMAKYKRVIAEGRCLMEAQVLGAKGEVPKYNDLEAVYVEPLDSRDVIPYWHMALDEHYNSLNDTAIMRCMRTFNDLKAKKHRLLGEVFAASNDRANELLAHELKLVERL